MDEAQKFAHSVASLSSEFDVPRHKVSVLVTQNCIAYLPDQSCESCESPRPYRSREDFRQRQSYYSWGLWKCEDCIKAEQEVAHEQKARAVNIRRTLLQEELDTKRVKRTRLEALSFSEAVYLLSLLRVGGGEDLSFILPAESFPLPHSPTTELDREILDHLYRRHLICIHPESQPESVVIEEEEFTEFSPFKVNWNLPLSSEDPSPTQFMENLETVIKEDEWPGDWHEEAKQLYRLIALHECLQYLRVVMEEHGFELRTGEKTKLVLQSVLKDYSIAQVYNFIWRAVRDAAAFYLRESTSKAHAANIVPGSIQRMAERALSEGGI